MSANLAAATFNEQFEAIKNEVVYNSNWPNGTGYYDNAIKGEHAVNLRPGEMAKCISSNDRKMIFVGTRFGTLVVFQRFSGGNGGVHVKNMPTKLSQLNIVENGGSISHSDMVRLIGTHWDHKPTNIGTLIESIIEAANTTGVEELN